MKFSRTRWLLLALLVLVPIVGAAVVAGPRLLVRMNVLDPVHLSVDLSDRTLKVIQGDEVVRTYKVAVGTARHPTPTGTFRTGRIEWNPRWVPPKSPWARKLKPREPGDPRNPMQGVKIYFREPAYYIHGTNDPASIGKAASHGCIRMRVSDARKLARTISRYGSVRLVIRA